MSAALLAEVLGELKSRLGIEEEIRLELRPMKTKAASISFRRNTIRINRNILNRLDRETVKYLLAHELTHFRLGSTEHNDGFRRELTKLMDEAKIREAEKRIVASLLELNKAQS